VLEGPAHELAGRHLHVAAQDDRGNEPCAQCGHVIDQAREQQVEHRRALRVADHYERAPVGLVVKEVLEARLDAVVRGYRLRRAEVEVRVRFEVGQSDLPVDRRVDLTDRRERRRLHHSGVDFSFPPSKVGVDRWLLGNGAVNVKAGEPGRGRRLR
jgi:hypothetical protein